ncbi:MAG: DUF6498-containing protein [Xanthomonadales bacterium]|jgi:hypothetical protein|nr:DUF6498-containing protein [Xanthomonadales bacterium]
MIRKGIRPGFSFGFERPLEGEVFRREYRFRRSWVAIIVLLVMDLVFLVPAVTTFQQISGGLGDFNSLFDLVGVLFLSAWLLGWSMAPLLMTSILVVMIFGREVVRVGPDLLRITIGLPFIGLAGNYEIRGIRNLRIEQAIAKSGKSWRGRYFEFDFGANSVAFGSDVHDEDRLEIEHALESASGKPLREGEARPDEIMKKWEKAPEEPMEAYISGATVEEPPAGWLSASTLVLILANLVPIAGAAFMGWKLSDVMVIYWAESAVIGFFNLCKIAVIGRWSALLAGPFFVGHFGAFMVVHFLFLYTIFVQGVNHTDSTSGDLKEVAALFVGLWPALLALLFSHGFSFFTNFMGRKEYEGRTVSQQMSEPYGRIIFMHMVLIIGGGLTLILGGATPVLLGVITLKVFVDIRAHRKQRSNKGKAL